MTLVTATAVSVIVTHKNTAVIDKIGSNIPVFHFLCESPQQMYILNVPMHCCVKTGNYISLVRILLYWKHACIVM